VPKSIASDLDGLSAMPFSQNQTCSELRHDINNRHDYISAKELVYYSKIALNSSEVPVILKAETSLLDSPLLTQF